MKSFNEIIDEFEKIDESCDAYSGARRVIRRLELMEKNINQRLDDILALIMNKEIDPPKYINDPYGEENWEEK